MIHRNEGFTLIELSIVLVIIGLIVGGVLVGQDLIKAAYVREQISQIEKYNTAVNTFYGKYQALPGDMNNSVATAFGFAARGPNGGEGDGNGIIQTDNANQPYGAATYGAPGIVGESGRFWVDLTTANGLNLNLIDGGFSSAIIDGCINGCAGDVMAASVGQYFPAAKIGNGNYVYVWSGGWFTVDFSTPGDGKNYFGISVVTRISEYGSVSAINAGLTVKQAYDIDRKVDDGYPQSGNVTAQGLMIDGAMAWADYAGGYPAISPPWTTPTPGSTTTCFDNGNANGAVQQYTMEIGGGNAANCTLAFKMQAGD